MVFKHESYDVTIDAMAPLQYRTRPGVEFTTATDPKSGSRQFFAKDRASGDIYQLGEEELFVCQLLDGTRSFRDIQAAFKARFEAKLTDRQFADFLRELDVSGLLALSGPAASPSPAGETGGAVAGHRTAPFQFRLFNPAHLFRICAWLCGPVRYLLWLLPPATLLAGLILFHRWPDAFAEHRLVDFSVASILIACVATLLAANFFARLVQGSVARAFGATINEFGMTFTLGVIPGFYIDRRPIQRLRHRERIWCHAAPLLARLSLFAVGTFVWVSLRPSATSLSDIAFLVGQVGFWSLVVTSIPFLPTDGYLLLASMFDRPDYIDRAFRVLGMRVAGQPLPQALRGRDTWLFILFAGAVIICIIAALAGGILFLGAPLEARYRGAGASMFIAAFALAILWLLLSWRSVQRVRAAANATAASRPNVVPIAGPGGTATARASAAARPATALSAGQSRSSAKPRRRALPYFIWAAILSGLGYVAFLPYPYEAGGDFQVLPTTRGEVRARVDGEVLELLVKEGDWVEENQPLARLSAWDKVRDLAVAKAAMTKAEAELQILVEGPKPEDIVLAEAQVGAARARTTFSRAEADRQSQLVKSGTSSKREAEHASSEYRKALADLAVAEASLDRTRSGPTASMIDAAKAEVAQYREQVAFLESQIERTEVRATMAGRIVTPNIELQHGMYLTTGSLFAVIERSQVAQAEILVPETDIAEVQLGDSVRLKPWGNSDAETLGEVISISPTAEKTPYGPVVRVKTQVDNADGFLRPEMTGYAKIDGSEMPVWEAYTRLFVRFFNIELWSWIP